MEIKYEAVFGPQELFDGMMNGCEFVSEEYGYMFANGALYYCERYNEKAGWALSCKSYLTFKPSAMRRIIRTPTWTVADQKAGRLPDVGSKFLFNGEELCCHYVDGNGEIWANNFKGEVVTPLLREITPIETPEERTKREREEWCSKALDLARILSEMKRYELKRLGEYIGSIHDALQSGELPMPNKESE